VPGERQGSASKESNAIPLVSLANKQPIQDDRPQQSTNHGSLEALLFKKEKERKIEISYQGS
jgi:hypothetical protein